jgi:hypothetical protein
MTEAPKSTEQVLSSSLAFRTVQNHLLSALLFGALGFQSVFPWLQSKSANERKAVRAEQFLVMDSERAMGLVLTYKGSSIRAFLRFRL